MTRVGDATLCDDLSHVPRDLPPTRCGQVAFRHAHLPRQLMSTRRRFLSFLGGSSVLGAVGVPSVADAAHQEHDAPLQQGTFDFSWTDRVTGKYKAVFDSPEAADGAALFRAVAWCDMYKDAYGTDRRDMSPVVVFRHAAMPMIMKNEFWETYEVGKSEKWRDEQGKKWAKKNPLSTGGAELSAAQAKYKIETFLASGGIVLACNWAFGGIVGTIREKENLSAAEARQKALSLMVPGVILQPNGIFAALRAQEAGCHYVLASSA